MLAEHEMFDKFGGDETSKQGQAAETILCQAKNVGQFRQTFTQCSFTEMKSTFIKLQNESLPKDIDQELLTVNNSV